MPSSEEDQARRASKEAKKRKRHVWDKIEQTLHNLAQYHENSKTNFDPGRCSVRVLIGQNWGTLRLAILEEVYGAVEKVEKELADGKHEFVRGMRVFTDVPALLVRPPPSLPYRQRKIAQAERTFAAVGHVSPELDLEGGARQSGRPRAVLQRIQNAPERLLCGRSSGGENAENMHTLHNRRHAWKKLGRTRCREAERNCEKAGRPREARKGRTRLELREQIRLIRSPFFDVLT